MNPAIRTGFRQRALRSALATLGAVAATNSAQAVFLANSGMGQVLLYPYYTVRSVGGNAYNTLFSVVNDTGSVKALRVRFLEGKNGRPVFDANLYLGPYDVWTGGLLPSATGTTLRTEDTSCLVPALPAAGIDFVNYAYTDAAADGSDPTLDRTREGFFEILGMGALTQPTYAAYATHTQSWARANIPASVPLLTAVPFNCAALAALDAGAGLASAIAPPTGGLFGSMVLVNVPEGTEYTADAVALANWSAQALWYPAGYANPQLTQVNPRVSATVARPAPNAPEEYVETTWPEASTLPADPVSAVLMQDDIANEYVIEPVNSSAGTDWVVSFPTKRFYYGPWLHFPDGAILGRVQGLFQRNYYDGASDLLDLRIFDREERSTGATICFSTSYRCPPIYETFWAANAVTLNNSVVLGSNYVANHPAAVPYGTPDGWLRMGFPNGTYHTTYPHLANREYHALYGGPTLRRKSDGTEITQPAVTYYGLPVIGFAVHRYTFNAMPTASGTVLSNYGGSFVHKGVRRFE
ncbi:MAG: hypothetical protein HYZ17_06400 [Betaproteobacteria bacterium]|nr:hypothetical protein [Betaproteobacteria bacterium]